MAKRDRRKIETCPFNGDIPCRTSTLVRNLTRSVLMSDGNRREALRWVQQYPRGPRYVIANDCVSCTYCAERVPEKVPAPKTHTTIELDEATVEGYRMLYAAARAVHGEEVPLDD